MTTMSWDQSEFDRAMAQAAQFTKRTPKLAVNTAAFFAARGWTRETPRVARELITQQLNAPVIVRAEFKRGLTRGEFLTGAKGRNATMPRAAAIIQRRVGKQGKHGLAESPFKGVTRAQGRQRMRKMVAALIASRRRSRAYLASSVIPIIKGLEAQVEPQYRRGAPPVDRQSKQYGIPKGHVDPATEGIVAQATISSDIGVTADEDAEKYNAALWRHAEPSLGKALMAEAARQLDYVARKEMEVLQRLFR